MSEGHPVQRQNRLVYLHIPPLADPITARQNINPSGTDLAFRERGEGVDNLQNQILTINIDFIILYD